jgi:hypothetical protein
MTTDHQAMAHNVAKDEWFYLEKDLLEASFAICARSSHHQAAPPSAPWQIAPKRVARRRHNHRGPAWNNIT